jgi:hypothetical protein
MGRSTRRRRGSRRSGFSPGDAALMMLENEECVFVKAVGPKPNANPPAFHRREAHIVASLTDGLAAPAQ